MSGFKKNTSERGFEYQSFLDAYGDECVIQESSSAMERRIWLGIKSAKPQIMVSDAKKLGIETHGRNSGWMPYEIPKEVMIGTTMHLDRKLVNQLIPLLQYFVRTGYLPENDGEVLLTKMGWEIQKGESSMGSVTDLFAIMEIEGIEYELLIDDGESTGIYGNVYHVWVVDEDNPNPEYFREKIYEGVIDDSNELSVVMKTLGLNNNK